MTQKVRLLALFAFVNLNSNSLVSSLIQPVIKVGQEENIIAINQVFVFIHVYGVHHGIQKI